MVSPTTIKAIYRELTHLTQNPPPDIRVTLSESDILSFTSFISGPAGTPYFGGYFRITFDFTDVDYPNQPPKCKFSTPIFHPNVSRTGEICVSSLKKDWRKEYGIERILLTVRCLMIEPNPDSALDAEASRLMQKDWETYVETAKMWSSVHASKKPACFEEEGAASASELKIDSNPQSQTAKTQQVPKAMASGSTPATQPLTAAVRTRPAVTTAPKRGLRRL